MSTTDLDELLELLQKNAQEKEQKVQESKLDTTQRFISKLGVVQGLDRVPNYVIFYTYQKVYKKKLGEDKLPKVHFFRNFNRYFDQTRTGRQRYYLLDGKSFDLTRNGLLEAKKHDEEYKIKVQKANGTYKKPKRKRRISVPKEES